jgi:hypothetical protein
LYMRSLGWVFIMGPVHQPEVADEGGLRQAGRTRCVYVERRVIDGDVDTLGGAERFAGQLFDLSRYVGQIAAAVAVRPYNRVGRKMRQGAAKGAQQFLRHDDVPRFDGVDAMSEGRAHEMSVEERDDPSGAADADPDRHVFRPVRHHQADGVASADPVHPGPAGIAVGAFEQGAEGQGLGIGNERRRVREAFA